jgi:hypothetical protein
MVSQVMVGKQHRKELNYITIWWTYHSLIWLTLWQLGIKANLQLNNYEDFLHCTFDRSEGPMDNTICLVLINILHMQQEVEKKPQFFSHIPLKEVLSAWGA